MAWFMQLAVASAALVSAVIALGTSYDHDGKTTYCWHIDEPASNAKLSELDRTQEYSGTNGCPIAMTISLDATTVEVNTPVNVTWTVSADFRGSNLVNMTELAYGQDNSGHTAQIVHSNVHSCVYQSGCDPFYDGQQLEDKTSNQIANLTDNAAAFKDAVQFSADGLYSVLAHIIMPDTNSSRQFAYAVYVELTVTEAKQTDTTEAPVVTTTNNSGGISQAAIIGIIVGGVVVVVALLVVAFVVWRRQDNNTVDMSNYSYPPPPPYDAASELYSEGPKGNAGGSDAGTARATESWSIPANSLPARSLDGTNGSNASRSSHPTSQDRDGYTSYSAGYMYRPVDTEAQRKRRVDSDVEL
ncbi:Extracellular matrix protein [Phytophthora megakarya]|uniref:Extracellular matrix protein n=1 Tax=Phytophthora megakarya TaxID=4795 RepID=A0A225WMK2_9STRA|nr:Extracellular matrix protein [Phytophthora megakarya]